MTGKHKRRLWALASVAFLAAACNGGENGSADVPEEVAKLQSKAARIDKNALGFWEAELAEGHVMVEIPAGEFTMGTDDGPDNERPAHTVYLDGYWLSKYPVTVGQFRRFVDTTGYVTDSEQGAGCWVFVGEEWEPRLDGTWKNPYFEQEDSHPVVCVSWYDAMAYAQWLSEETGVELKLPTAAQWEKGARGTDQRTWPWGNEIPDGARANYADVNYWNKYGEARVADKNVDDGYVETSPVGSYPAGASPYGLLDMAGNVWEWCHDYYADDYYAESPHRNPLGPLEGRVGDDGVADRVNRGGGSWTDRSGHLTADGGHNLRSAGRTGDGDNSSDDHMGFRLCIDGIPRPEHSRSR
jgi:formylglycine-generating enzyme required for sulfatase activity